MADRELRRMHRAELIEIIYALKQSEDQLKAQNAALTAQLQDRQLRLESAGSIAQAALELNNVFAAAQAVRECAFLYTSIQIKFHSSIDIQLL